MASIPSEIKIPPEIARGVGLPLPLPPEDWPSVEHLVVEDGKPVDNIFSALQMRLLVESLHASWRGPNEDGRFVALANVGLFYSINQPGLAPDVMVSTDVQLPKDFKAKVKQDLSYFTWIYGKVPDVVIEIVSNREGGEIGEKRRTYHRIRVGHYVIFDPWRLLGGEALQVLDWLPSDFRPSEKNWLYEVGLGLVLWNGKFEGVEGVWLRWCNRQGGLLSTGTERADRLAEQLRQLGVKPDA